MDAGKIKAFLEHSSGFGFGSSSGFGFGSGSGSGFGSSSGFGFGISSINGEDVYIVDGIQTIFRHIRENIAKACILNSDLTLTPCYVVKGGRHFAHGENLHKAMEALRDKLFEDMPKEDRISAFVAEHELDKVYPNRDLYDWHHRLTGSCEMGRDAFAKDHDIDVDKGSMTVKEFVELTKNAYGGDVIRKVWDAYGKKA